LSDIDYHDSEWAVPVHDDRRLFECLILEAAQAGLSWYTVLRKRAQYRIAFAHFDPAKVARYDAQQLTALLGNPGIIRHRQKIRAAIHNARMPGGFSRSRRHSAVSRPICGGLLMASRLCMKSER